MGCKKVHKTGMRGKWELPRISHISTHCKRASMKSTLRFFIPSSKSLLRWDRRIGASINGTGYRPVHQRINRRDRPPCLSSYPAQRPIAKRRGLISGIDPAIGFPFASFAVAPLTADRHKKISAGAKNLLLNHHWPGNIRELQNTLRRAMVWSDGEILTREAIEEALLPGFGTEQKNVKKINHQIELARNMLK